MIVECSNCKYYEADFSEEPCKSCISYRYFVSREEAKKEETIRAEAVKEFADRLKARGIPVTGGKGFEGVTVMASNLVIDDLVNEMVGETNAK